MSRLQLLCKKLPKLVIPPRLLTTFTLFSKLPLELRNKVWGFVATVPRDIHLAYFHDERLARSNPPAIFYATSESKSEALDHYKACRESKCIPPEHVCRESFLSWCSSFFKTTHRTIHRSIWVNFNLDHLVWTRTKTSHLPQGYGRLWVEDNGRRGCQNFNFED